MSRDSRDLIQVCSDNETPFMLPEPISVDHDVTDSPPPPPNYHHHHHQQQQQQQQHEQQVLESRDEPDCPSAITSPDVTRQPVTSSRLSTVKASDITSDMYVNGNDSCKRNYLFKLIVIKMKM